MAPPIRLKNNCAPTPNLRNRSGGNKTGQGSGRQDVMWAADLVQSMRHNLCHGAHHGATKAFLAEPGIDATALAKPWHKSVRSFYIQGVQMHLCHLPEPNQVSTNAEFDICLERSSMSRWDEWICLATVSVAEKLALEGVFLHRRSGRYLTSSKSFDVQNNSLHGRF